MFETYPATEGRSVWFDTTASTSRVVPSRRSMRNSKVAWADSAWKSSLPSILSTVPRSSGCTKSGARRPISSSGSYCSRSLMAGDT